MSSLQRYAIKLWNSVHFPYLGYDQFQVPIIWHWLTSLTSIDSHLLNESIHGCARKSLFLSSFSVTLCLGSCPVIIGPFFWVIPRVLVVSSVPVVMYYFPLTHRGTCDSAWCQIQDLRPLWLPPVISEKGKKKWPVGCCPGFGPICCLVAWHTATYSCLQGGARF